MINPVGNNVLIKPDETKTKTSGGLYIPNKYQEKTYRGTVIAVGPGEVLEDGKRKKMTVKEGDDVLYSQKAGTELVIGGDSYLLLQEYNILTVVE